ncbi:putative disease resistance RPP13-like protein 1 [Rutidosis leptorrhynchoides]|uniref:putative disease resistance RPP13-like protein 1 n=1 Tax=Rutidosis leptorrhynchoides TaxID=125765 RepID=UPI003A9A6072
MAEIVVSAVVSVLIEKLISGDLMKLARSEGIDSQLKKWKKTLPMIEALLDDAGQKYITQRAVKLWLQELHHLAYDIDDVLDDMATEIMRRKFNDEQHAGTSSSKVLKSIIPTCCTNFTPHKMMYGRKISSMIDEITEKLNDLVEQKSNLGLDINVKVEIRSNRTNNRSQETSLVDVSKVFGREADKEALLEKLLGDETRNQNVCVVSIVGLGGIGKTTLAKLLYNDEKVMDHFELRAWVCVSDEFDLFKISKVIYQAVTGEDKTFASLDLLQVALKEKLAMKRFLIVLDDVWNEDHNVWDTLERPLVGAPGSKVILTTRKTTVASVMNSVQPHILKVLSDEDTMSLFAKYALDEPNFEKHPSLIEIAQSIIEKCNGLPLALIALGRVLKSKGNDEYEWAKLLKSEIWRSEDRSDILPALKLSYYDLPSPLKQLFAYCCFFPKDYVFNKNELVLLWMAEGFLNHPKGNMSMESLGCQYFEELESRSFFQQLTDSESKYTMHDLMNDLAISVAGEFFYLLDDKMDVNGRNEAFEKFRHFSFLGHRHDEFNKLKELHRSRHLRTFLPLSVGWTPFVTLDDVLLELLPQLRLLRVLSLNRYSITNVPQSIGGLKHLRYLNFSSTNIRQVPEEVGELYNLQSLLVCDCMELFRLPINFSKLINLRHLDMSNTPMLRKTPLGLGGLTSLQTLSKVNIEGVNGFKLSDLKGLLNLEGKLSITGLDKVMDPKQAMDANLKGKDGLVSLDMEWSGIFDDSRNLMIEYEVFQSLRPPIELNKLNILHYGGIKCPSWFADLSFNKLTELKLEGFINCTSFHNISIPSLVSLGVLNMVSLKIWSNSEGDNAKKSSSFPRLRNMYIDYCPKLVEVSIGLLPSLEVLILKSCPEAVLRGIVDVSSAIQMLELFDITNLIKLHGIAFPSLEYLKISNMEDWERWSNCEDDKTIGSCPHLCEVCIEYCPKLAVVSPGLIPSLEVLDLTGCSEAGLRAMVSTSSTIQKLELQNIKNLTKLDGEVLKHLTEIEYLGIRYCDELRYVSESVGKKELNVGSSNMKHVIRDVDLSDCNSLENYNCPNSVEKLEIASCSSITSLTLSTTLQELPFSLKIVKISSCEKLKSFPHEHLQCLTSLEEMCITSCRRMDSFPCGLWPPNLRKLTIGELKKPMSKWGLQNYPTSLVELCLFGFHSGVTSFAMEGDAMNNASTSFLLPPSLTSLRIIEFEDVESISEVLPHLIHLQELLIQSCQNVKDVLESTSSLMVHVS